ncbi:MAG TPA: hypothetical protein VJ817_15040 [Gemmatimonadales bacterium]|nr:hypothetical protein [Gemmatimonadales bacterium]
MRKLGFFTLAAAALAAGCDESTGPSVLAESYALARIGLLAPPIPLGPDGGPPFLLADTLRLTDPRPREEIMAVLTRIQVTRDGNGISHRMESQHRYQFDGDILSYDSCPIDAFCIASLVYAPIDFQVVGDSLFQVGPEASPLPQSVYGRVRR